MIGGIQETQDMLDYCAEHNIVSDIELTTAIGVHGPRELYLILIDQESEG